MKRKAYSVDEKLFYLLLEENFDELNIDELQELFGNSDYEISDKWVFISYIGMLEQTKDTLNRSTTNRVLQSRF